MKNNRYFLISIIVILVICNVVLLYLMQKQKNDTNAMLTTLYPYTQKALCLENNLKMNLEFAQSKITDISVSDITKSEKKISDLFANGDTTLFVVRISDRFCHSCVESCVGLFNSGKIVSPYKIVYFVEIDNFIKFEKEAKDLHILDKNVYKVDFLESNIDAVGFPYLMVLNKDLSIKYCYFPRKEHEKIDIEYLKVVFDGFEKNKN